MPIYRVSYCICEEKFETEIQQFFAEGITEKENMFQLFDSEWLIDSNSTEEGLRKKFDPITLSAKAEIFISEIFQEHIALYMKPEREKAYLEWLSRPHINRSANHT